MLLTCHTAGTTCMLPCVARSLAAETVSDDMHTTEAGANSTG